MWPPEGSDVEELIRNSTQPEHGWSPCLLESKTPVIGDYQLAREYESIIVKMGNLSKGYKAKALALERKKRVMIKASTKYPGESSTDGECDGQMVLPVSIPKRKTDNTGKRQSSCATGGLHKKASLSSGSVGELPENRHEHATSGDAVVEHRPRSVDFPSNHLTPDGSARPQDLASWDSFLEEYRKDRERMFSFCREIIDNQKEIMERVKAVEMGAATGKFYCPVELPVDDYETLQSVDSMLGEDRDFREYLMNDFTGVLSPSIGVFLRQNLKKLMTNRVAAMLNVNGVRNKKSILDLKHIVTLLKDAARTQPGRMDDISFNREMSLWLSQANRRKNGATASQMANHEAMNVDVDVSIQELTANNLQV